MFQRVGFSLTKTTPQLQSSSLRNYHKVLYRGVGMALAHSFVDRLDLQSFLSHLLCLT